jgi:hypothetical protein
MAGALALVCHAAPGVQGAHGERGARVQPSRVQSPRSEAPQARRQAGGAHRRSTAAPRARSQGSQSNTSSSEAVASSQGGIGVGSQSLVVDNHARAPASSAIAPPLTSSNDTCMGSASVGAAGVTFGLSLGKTYVDENCMMLKNSRELWNMGYRGAAIARMCMDARNREALELSGVRCPEPKKDSQAQASAGPEVPVSDF